jgi:hypothetical protein
MIRNVDKELSSGLEGTATKVVISTTSAMATEKWCGLMAAGIMATGRKAYNMESEKFSLWATNSKKVFFRTTF